MSNTILTDLTELAQAAAGKAEELEGFFTFLQLEVPLSDRQLQVAVDDTTAQVWQHIDCRSCANCCRVRHPLFTRVEVERIATYLGLPAAEIRARYLTSNGETGKYSTSALPCPFLDGNLCSIYPVRPAVCANYPHLYRNLRARFWITVDSAGDCPIVYNVLERLKTHLGFVSSAGAVPPVAPQNPIDVNQAL